LISADYYKRLCDFEVSSPLATTQVEIECCNKVYVNSSHSEHFFQDLITAGSNQFIDATFIVHGGDETISIGTARELASKGYKIKSVNWLGDPALVTPLPIGIPTRERLSGISLKDYTHYLSMFQSLSKKSSNRDVYLYANFDITTNLPLRKSALLASLHMREAYVPLGRVDVFENLEILNRSKFVLSPPGAGPDCFRTWESIYLGAVPIVLRSYWPFRHLDLPVLIVDSFEHLEQEITNYEIKMKNRNGNWEDLFRL
jgi:hypothetical protein